MQELADMKKLMQKQQPTIVGQVGPPDTSKVDKNKPKWEPKFGKETPADKFSFKRAIAALVNNDWSLAPFEKELSDSVQKALTWTDGSGGGLWVPEDFLGDEFIEVLRSKTVCRRAGCRVLNARHSPVILPTQTGSVDGIEWIGQAESVLPSDVTPAQKTLTPKIGMIRSQISRLQNYLSEETSETLVRDDMAAQMARGVDYAMLRGSGTTEVPEGMANDTSINTVDMASTNGAALTDADKLWECVYELEADNVPTDNLVWFMHPRTMMQVRTLTIGSDTNRYAFQPDLTGKSPGMLLGWPVYTTTQIPINLTAGSSTDASEIYLVNIPDLFLCQWGVMRLEASTVGGIAWTHEVIELKIVVWMDTVLRHSESCCLINDVVAA
jgi:HK97 family phage major capsid protein